MNIYVFVKGKLGVILQRSEEAWYGTSWIVRKSHRNGDEGSGRVF